MYYHPFPKIVLEAFHGSTPRLLSRMRYGWPSAWGDSARAAREEVQAVLRTVGLEMRLVAKEERFKARRPGGRRSPAYSYEVGEFAQIA